MASREMGRTVAAWTSALRDFWRRGEKKREKEKALGKKMKMKVSERRIWKRGGAGGGSVGWSEAGALAARNPSGGSLSV